MGHKHSKKSRENQKTIGVNSNSKNAVKDENSLLTKEDLKDLGKDSQRTIDILDKIIADARTKDVERDSNVPTDFYNQDHE